MTKFKVGDKVQVKTAAEYGSSSPLYGRAGQVATVCSVDHASSLEYGQIYNLNFQDDRTCLFYEDKIKAVEENTLVGKVFENSNFDHDRTVIAEFASSDGVEFLAYEDSDDATVGMRRKGVFLSNWTEKVEEEVKELTLEDVAKLAGVDVSKIRIKE